MKLFSTYVQNLMRTNLILKIRRLKNDRGQVHLHYRKKMSVMQRQVKFVISISGRRLYVVKSQFRWVENELSKKRWVENAVEKEIWWRKRKAFLHTQSQKCQMIKLSDYLIYKGKQINKQLEYSSTGWIIK